MLLCIDVGNTQMVIGLFDGPELMDHWRIATVAERTSDELGADDGQFLGIHGFKFDEHVTGVAICSGVPRVTGELREMTERYFGFPARCSSPGSAPACRSSTTTRRKWAPTGSRTRWRPTTSTAAVDRGRLRHREHDRGHQREG